jgi:hypothetical protein
VVAGDAHDPFACAKRAEPTRRSGDEARVEVDDVAGDHDEVGLHLLDEAEPALELALADERADVQVGELHDREAIEGARKARELDRNLFDHPVEPPAQRAPPEHRARSGERHRASDALESLAPLGERRRRAPEKPAGEPQDSHDGHPDPDHQIAEQAERAEDGPEGGTRKEERYLAAHGDDHGDRERRDDPTAMARDECGGDRAKPPVKEKMDQGREDVGGEERENERGADHRGLTPLATRS